MHPKRSCCTVIAFAALAGGCSRAADTNSPTKRPIVSCLDEASAPVALLERPDLVLIDLTATVQDVVLFGQLNGSLEYGYYRLPARAGAPPELQPMPIGRFASRLEWTSGHLWGVGAAEGVWTLGEGERAISVVDWRRTLDNLVPGGNASGLVVPELRDGGVSLRFYDWATRTPKELGRVEAARPNGVAAATDAQGTSFAAIGQWHDGQQWVHVYAWSEGEPLRELTRISTFPGSVDKLEVGGGKLYVEMKGGGNPDWDGRPFSTCVYRIDVATGESEMLTSDLAGWVDVEADEELVFLLDEGRFNTLADGRLRILRHDGSEVRTLEGLDRPRSLAVDGEAAYWYGRSSETTGIYRLAVRDPVETCGSSTRSGTAAERVARR